MHRNSLFVSLVLIVILLCNICASTSNEDDLLELLRRFDNIYTENGFTLSGNTKLYTTEKWPGHPEPITQSWKMTFQKEQGAVSYEINDLVEKGICYIEPGTPNTSHDPDGNFLFSALTKRNTFTDPANSGLYDEHTIYIVDDDNTVLDKGITPLIHKSRPGLNGVGRYVVELVWAIGRGFSPYIDKITETNELEDGMTHVVAIGHRSDKEKGRWELIIDSKNAWIIRSAKFFSDYQPQIIAAEIENSGIKWNGSLAMPINASLNFSGYLNSKGSDTSVITFTTITEGFDEVLLNKVKSSFRPPFKERTSIMIDTEQGWPMHINPRMTQKIATDLLGDLSNSENAIKNEAPFINIDSNSKKAADQNTPQQSELKKTLAQSNQKKSLFYLPRWLAYSMLVVGISGVIGLTILENRKRRKKQI